MGTGENKTGEMIIVVGKKIEKTGNKVITKKKRENLTMGEKNKIIMRDKTDEIGTRVIVEDMTNLQGTSSQ